MKNNKAYIIVIILLLLAVGYLGYEVSQRGNTIDTQEQEYSELDAERDKLEVDLMKMRMSYDTLNTENNQLMAEMDAQKQEIDELLDKLRNRNWSISKLQKEASTLRDIMKGYVVTIDSLNTLNKELMAENENMKTQVSSVQEKNKELENRQENMEKIIETGQTLQTDQIDALAIRLRNSGKQTDTRRARRAEMFRTCFVLRENKIAPAGKKTLYLRIIDPNGQLMKSDEQNDTRPFDGEDKAYSVSRTIDYNNQETDVCIFYTLEEEPPEGDYKIHIYEDNKQIGTADLSLR
jgi:DNA repair ATPase RecN